MHIKKLSIFLSAFLVTSVTAVAAFEVPVAGTVAALQSGLSENGTTASYTQTRMSWDQDRDGGRCRSRSDSCRHLHNGYWYETQWWMMPMMGGAAIMNMENDHSNPNSQYNRDNNLR